MFNTLCLLSPSLTQPFVSLLSQLVFQHYLYSMENLKIPDVV